jgi:NAD(P)-dependent dehydrogenase (short-subunit alcohol dehydrogenase family)
MLEGKKILVTGASSGIGREVALMLAKQGSQLILTGRNKERLLETVSKTNNESIHKAIVADLSIATELNDLLSQLPLLDGIVFNAGMVDYKPIKFLKQEDINQTFQINTFSAILLATGLMKNKKISKGGSLVFISSISSKLGVPGTALYASSKAALTGFARVLASELAPQKIRCNVISPGIVETALTSQSIAASSEESMKKQKSQYPLGFGKPEDVANIVKYLLSDECKWMTGSEITLDGGFLLN